jgi:hypothetical protein
MNRRFSFLTGTVGALALVAAGATVDLEAQRGGGAGAGQGRPPNVGANPGQGGARTGGNPNTGGGGANTGNPNQGGNANAGGSGANTGNPNQGGNANAGGGGGNGNQGGKGNAGGGRGNSGNAKGGGQGNAGKDDGAGRPDGVGRPDGAARGRGNANANRPDGEQGGQGRGRANANSRDTEGFKNYGQLVAARHVSENLGIDFDQLKTLMTGDNPKSLGQAIQELRPEADANAEAARAERRKRRLVEVIPTESLRPDRHPITAASRSSIVERREADPRTDVRNNLSHHRGRDHEYRVPRRAADGAGARPGPHGSAVDASGSGKENHGVSERADGQSIPAGTGSTRVHVRIVA